MANLANEIIRYAEELELVGGDHDGQPFQALPWERRFIRGAFGRQTGPAALSIARGNGKSGLVAVLACAMLDPAGPLHGNRRDVVCVAAAFSQAKIVFADVAAMMRKRYALNDKRTWRVQDSANTAEIRHVPSGSTVHCIGSNPDLIHGKRPALALCDEPAKWPAARAAKMYAGIRGGLGKVQGSKLIALGTQAIDVDHWFAKLLAGAGGVGYRQIHAASEGDAPFTLRTIRKANPSYDHLPSLRAQLAEEAKAARVDSAERASWDSQRLNRPVSDTVESLVIDLATWQQAEGDVPADGPYVLGVDIGQSDAMSACAAYWPLTGRLDGFAVFPAIPNLAERGKRDHVGDQYARMSERGELMVCGDRVTDLPAMLQIAADRWGNPAAVVGDDYRKDELLQALEGSRIPMCHFETRRVGYYTGNIDLTAYRRALISGKCRPVPSLLLRAGMAEARTATDTSGNVKLAKGTQSGRRRRAKDDIVAASILAVSTGERLHDEDKRRNRSKPTLRRVA